MNETVPEMLRAGATTFEERNKTYGENYLLVGEVMRALFPAGVSLKTADDFLLWHVFELIVIKLTRLSCSNLTHIDSAHDAMVYAAMLEKLIRERR